MFTFAKLSLDCTYRLFSTVARVCKFWISPSCAQRNRVKKKHLKIRATRMTSYRKDMLIIHLFRINELSPSVLAGRVSTHFLVNLSHDIPFLSPHLSSFYFCHPFFSCFPFFPLLSFPTSMGYTAKPPGYTFATVWALEDVTFACVTTMYVIQENFLLT